MRIMVSCPSNRYPDWDMMATLHQAIFVALHQGYMVDFRVPNFGTSNMAFARQKELARFLKTGADFLFMVDDDVSVPKHTLTRLASHDKDIVGGVVRKKQKMCQVCADVVGSLDDNLRKKRMVRANSVGTGCTMVKRALVERMIGHFPELEYDLNGETHYGLFMPMIVDRRIILCDYAFCERAKTVGAEIWLDHEILCTHWGRIGFGFGQGGEDARP